MVIIMKFHPKNNIDFLEKGGCFLYYFDSGQKCFLTRIIMDNDDVDVFSNPMEMKEFINHDCCGDINQCKYLNNLWDLDNKSNIDQPIPQEDINNSINNEIPLLNFSGINVDFDYSWPQESQIITDALLIPTTTNLYFNDFLYFDNNNDLILQKECKKRQIELVNLGDCIVTHGANTGYPKIAHCVIMEPRSLLPDIQDIGLAIYNSLVKLDDIGCQSISIFPFIKIDNNIPIPIVDIFLKVCLTSIMTFISEYETQSLSYILIHIPPNFISNLQDVIQDIDNIN